MNTPAPRVCCAACGLPTDNVMSPLCTACAGKLDDNELPPCLGEAIRDTTHELQRRAAGVED